MKKEEQDKKKMGIALYDVIDFLKHMSETTGAVKSFVRYDNCDGGVDVEICIRKHGKFSSDEFDPEKLKVIKGLAEEKLKSEKSEILQDIINICNNGIEDYDNRKKE